MRQMPSSLWQRTLGITAGSLDDPSVYKPQVVVFAKTDRDWDLIAADLPHFPGMPPVWVTYANRGFHLSAIRIFLAAISRGYAP